MNGDELYRRVLEVWPETLDISESTMVEGGGFICRPLIEQSGRIEAILQEKPDKWFDIACSSFHQAMWAHARQSFVNGVLTIRPSDVGLQAFDAKMRINLERSDWRDGRNRYIEANPHADGPQ